jgi:5-methyltetrahydrofolate--homocysteine methyltransferase
MRQPVDRSPKDPDAMYEALRSAIVEGDADRTAAITIEALAAGLDPFSILDRGLTSSLRHVGSCWEKGEIYLPEMMLAAEAVKSGIAVLKPRLAAAKSSVSAAAPPVCVMGTVAGDIHDIGKNIVATLLEASGFRVVDLGTDVQATRFVDAVREHGAGLLGMSALLTSTMPAMREVVGALEAAGLRRGLKIAVGGAPVTAAFARDIGADGTAADGMAALRLFQGLVAGEVFRAV